jgi:hypothetical protein
MSKKPMKLFYYYRTFDQAKKRRQKFQEETGLAWDYYQAAGGFQFAPRITPNTPLNDEAADRLHAVMERGNLFEYQNFVRISEKYGMPLPEVLEAVKTLNKRHPKEYRPNVSRAGGWTLIRRLKIHEMKEEE